MPSNTSASSTSEPLTLEALQRCRAMLMRACNREVSRRYIYPFTIKPDYEAPDWDTQGMETGIPTDINQWVIDDPDFLELEEP